MCTFLPTSGPHHMTSPLPGCCLPANLYYSNVSLTNLPGDTSLTLRQAWTCCHGFSPLPHIFVTPMTCFPALQVIAFICLHQLMTCPPAPSGGRHHLLPEPLKETGTLMPTQLSSFEMQDGVLAEPLITSSCQNRNRK